MQLVIFYLYLMLYTCVARFDVTENLKSFTVFFWKVNTKTKKKLVLEF
jgi:hypothetical protein